MTDVTHSDIEVVQQYGRLCGEVDTIRGLAREYRRKAGDSFASGQDEQAEALRQQAANFEARLNRRENKLAKLAPRVAEVEDKIGGDDAAPSEAASTNTGESAGNGGDGAVVGADHPERHDTTPDEAFGHHRLDGKSTGHDQRAGEAGV